MIAKRTGEDEIEGLQTEDVCHFLHKDDVAVAALNMCDEDNVHGLIIKNKKNYEVSPLNSRLKRMLDLWKPNNNATE